MKAEKSAYKKAAGNSQSHNKKTEILEKENKVRKGNKEAAQKEVIIIKMKHIHMHGGTKLYKFTNKPNTNCLKDKLCGNAENVLQNCRQSSGITFINNNKVAININELDHSK